MNTPEPLDDRDLDRLLSHAAVPEVPAGLAERIVAEAQRADRIPALPPVSPRRPPRRPWPRRTVIAIVAINLFAASALAAAWGGHDGFRRLSALSARVIHSITAVLPHRHKAIIGSGHTAAHGQHATIAVPHGMMALPRQRPIEPVAMRQPPLPIAAPVTARPARMIRQEQKAVRRAERKAERRAERRENRIARAANPERADRKAWRAGHRPDRPSNPARERRDSALRPQATGSPYDRMPPAGEQSMEPARMRDDQPAADAPRRQAKAGDEPAAGNRRGAREEGRGWRQRGGFRPWGRAGGFRARRGRR